jgi:hypothetical protein
MEGPDHLRTASNRMHIQPLDWKSTVRILNGHDQISPARTQIDDSDPTTRKGTRTLNQDHPPIHQRSWTRLPPPPPAAAEPSLTAPPRRDRAPSRRQSHGDPSPNHRFHLEQLKQEDEVIQEEDFLPWINAWLRPATYKVQSRRRRSDDEKLVASWWISLQQKAMTSFGNRHRLPQSLIRIHNYYGESRADGGSFLEQVTTRFKGLGGSTLGVEFSWI